MPRHGFFCAGSSEVERPTSCGEVDVSKSSRRTKGSVAQRKSTQSNALRGRKFESCPCPKLFVIGRADIPPGLRAAQMFHAARLFAAEFPDIEEEWFRESNTIVLLEVTDRIHLEGLFENAERLDISVSAFKEEDFPHTGITALCLGPEARKLLSNIPLALRS